MMEIITVFVYHVQTDELLVVLDVDSYPHEHVLVWDELEEIDDAVWDWCRDNDVLWEDIEWVREPRLNDDDV